MQLKLVTDFEELNNYRTEWNELVNNTQNKEIFYSWEWMENFLKHFKNDLISIFTILILDNNKVIGIAPLAIRKKKIGFLNVKVLQPLINKTADYCDFYFHKDYNNYELLKKIFKEIYKYKDKWDYIELINFNTRSNNTYLINEIITNSFKNNCYIEKSVITPFLLYSESSNKVNKKQIKDIERRERNIKKDNELSINIDNEWDIDVWNKLIEFHKNKWKHGVFHDSNYIKFYKDIIPIFYEKDQLEFSNIKIDGEIAAIHFGFKNENKVYYYIPIYNPKYRNTGVGYILLNHLIQIYKNSKVEFDFLRGNELYKFDWTDNTYMNFNLYVVNNKWYITTYIKLMLWAKQSKLIRKILNK